MMMMQQESIERLKELNMIDIELTPFMKQLIDIRRHLLNSRAKLETMAVEVDSERWELIQRSAFKTKLIGFHLTRNHLLPKGELKVSFYV